jgi:hypothetical protein
LVMTLFINFFTIFKKHVISNFISQYLKIILEYQLLWN